MKHQLAPSLAAESARGRRGLFFWPVWFLAALIVYVLSVGPAMKLYDKNLLSERALVVYDPLFACCARIPLFDRLYDWYVEGVWNVNLG